MAIPEQRLSSTVQIAPYLETDSRERQGYIDDYEDGPIALEDTSEGIKYQPWRLHVDNGEFVLTPETVGDPVRLLSGLDVAQCSLAFDQNGHQTIAWVDSGSQGHLYWYDTAESEYVITDYPDTKSMMLCMDDKRAMQIGANDILLFSTEGQPDGTFNLYHRMQRDRFETPYLMASDVPTFIDKLGMHKGLRVQITLTYDAA